MRCHDACFASALPLVFHLECVARDLFTQTQACRCCNVHQDAPTNAVHLKVMCKHDLLSCDKAWGHGDLQIYLCQCAVSNATIATFLDPSPTCARTQSHVWMFCSMRTHTRLMACADCLLALLLASTCAAQAPLTPPMAMPENAVALPSWNWLVTPSSEETQVRVVLFCLHRLCNCCACAAA